MIRFIIAREPTEEVTKDRLLSCLERHKNYVKSDQDRIEEIDFALSVLHKYVDSQSNTGSETDV